MAAKIRRIAPAIDTDLKSCQGTVRLSAHAEARRRERGISAEAIRHVLALPDTVYPSVYGNVVYVGWQRGSRIAVVIVPELWPVLVVTCFYAAIPVRPLPRERRAYQEGSRAA